MRRLMWMAVALLAWAGDPPEKKRPPDYLARQPAESKVRPASRPKTKPDSGTARLDPADAKAAPKASAGQTSGTPPSVSEMQVVSRSQGKSETAPKRDQPGIHGEARLGGGPAGGQTSGAVVVEDKKNGKWAATVSGDSVKRRR